MPDEAREDHDASPTPRGLGALLAAAAGGDEAAWRAIVDAYAARVHGLVLAQCGDRDLAEEIVQSTFCTVASKLSGYVESGRFEAWLFRIAVNRLRDEQRRRRRQASPTDDAILGVRAAPDGDRAAERSERDEQRRRLRSALARLADADQRVVHLRHVGGLSFREIAEVLGEPLGTVLARHHRALRKLRDLLEPGDPRGRSGA